MTRWNYDMTILQFPPPSRQADQPQHKRGIAGLFWQMPIEHRRERIAAMLRAGFHPQLVRSLTSRPPR